MASCKDCAHVEVCGTFLLLSEAFEITSPERIASDCEHFTNRSRFVELPCKVGDTVYSVHGHPDYGYKIEALQAQDVALICSSGELSYSKRLNYFGKTVFLTREEAEKALNEREENA